TLWTTRFIDGKHDRKHAVHELCLDIVVIDGAREGDRSLKHASRNFPHKPTVCLSRVRHSALLGLLLALHLTLESVLALFLMTIATANSQSIDINGQFNILRSCPWKRDVHFITIGGLIGI